ncbi:ABC transporter substrate-binding protein [Anaerococcus sp. ENR1011]|uniref:ABC transporter substrate-binding protein n=1 Tax=Anaerococcus groningensis TaxID=3115616 RepID=A0ABW9MZA5_9FIRM
MKYFKTLLLSLALILAGCSSNQEVKPEESTVTEEQAETKSDLKEAEKEEKEESTSQKEGYPKTITDLSGNEITLEKPLDKVIIQGSSSGGPFMTMMYLDKDNFLSKIAAMDDSVKLDRNDFYTRLEKVMPEIEEVPRIANFMDNDFSYEAILNTDADGIIAPIGFKTQIEAIQEKIDIPVFYVDYHSQEFDKHIASTKLIADVTGLDKNLDELIDFYTSKVSPIIERKFDESKKPKVYVEHGYEGEKEYGNSYGSNKMWGKIVEDCGGHNIGSDALGADEAIPLASEFVLSENPEKIILTGSQWIEKPHSMKMGYDTTADWVHEKIDKYKTRPGWSDLDAMKNHEVYVISQQLVRDMSDFYAYEYLAKTLHPDIYGDLDPDKDLKEFYEKFMPIDLEGTWSYKYEEK